MVDLNEKKQTKTNPEDWYWVCKIKRIKVAKLNQAWSDGKKNTELELTKRRTQSLGIQHVNRGSR